jgi:glycosyltransferase involved in cell wall biosynthesis
MAGSAEGRLRVVLCGEYPTRPGDLRGGGVQAVTAYLAQALARRGDVELHVVASVREPPAVEVELDGYVVHYVARPPLPRLLTCYPYDVPRLVRRIRRLEPDIVHGQGQTRHGLAAVRCGLPHVVTPHGVLFVESRLLRTSPAGYLKSWLLDGQERDLFRRARDIILISRYLESVYGALLRGKQLHFVENPVDEAFFGLRRDPDPHELLFVGGVMARKRVHLLVRALAHVRRQEPRARLRIVGPWLEGEELERVRRAVAEHSLEDAVELTGPVAQEAILEAYARAGALVLASREETAPQAIAQALASGVPVVAVAAGGVPFMVRDGETALLVREPRPEAIAAAILRLWREPGLRERLVEEGRRQARERFLASAVAERTVAVYRDVIARSGRART